LIENEIDIFVNFNVKLTFFIGIKFWYFIMVYFCRLKWNEI